MSIKYILIPYDKYQALIGQNHNFFENAIQKYKNSPLYNTAYGQYLHHLNKTPIIATPQNYSPYLTEKTQEVTPNMTMKTPLLPEKTYNTDMFTPSLSRFKLWELPDSSTNVSEDGASPAPALASGSVHTTPNVKSRTSKRQASSRKEELKAKAEDGIDKIVKIIEKNRSQYGISRTGHILDDKNKPIINSNVKESITRLVYPHEPGDNTPPGTKKLQQRLDKKTKNFIESIRPMKW